MDAEPRPAGIAPSKLSVDDLLAARLTPAAGVGPVSVENMDQAIATGALGSRMRRQNERLRQRCVGEQRSSARCVETNCESIRTLRQAQTSTPTVSEAREDRRAGGREALVGDGRAV